jgi:hypothetical protein
VLGLLFFKCFLIHTLAFDQTCENDVVYLPSKSGMKLSKIVDGAFFFTDATNHSKEQITEESSFILDQSAFISKPVFFKIQGKKELPSSSESQKEIR